MADTVFLPLTGASYNGACLGDDSGDCLLSVIDLRAFNGASNTYALELTIGEQSSACSNSDGEQ